MAGTTPCGVTNASGRAYCSSRNCVTRKTPKPPWTRVTSPTCTSEAVCPTLRAARDALGVADLPGGDGLPAFKGRAEPRVLEREQGSPGYRGRAGERRGDGRAPPAGRGRAGEADRDEAVRPRARRAEALAER